MEKKKESKNKNKKQLIKKKKCNSFKNAGFLKDFLEKPEDIKTYSCNNIINFVPKISPKPSFCKPSLFVLNPEEKFIKRLSQNKLEHNLIIMNDSDSGENSSNLESFDEDVEKYSNLNKEESKKGDIIKKNKDKQEEIINKYSTQDSSSISNFDNYNNNCEKINNDSIEDQCEDIKYLSIFDVLSKNYK